MAILSAQINDYAFGEVIGVGTVGTIYAAVDKRSQKNVAIKKLHPGICQDALVRARFAREALIMERLHHPHIVRSFGGGDDQGQLFYVMEVVDGGSVKDLLQKNGAFEWPIVVEIGRQVCSALQFAHNHGVIHRDLKPSNLFLTRDADVKLGDFGIARDLQSSDITSSGMTVGTHAYMAPEQITGDAAFNVVMRRKQKTIDPSTGTTVYEFWFSPQTLGVAKLKKDLYFGLGVAVVDSDPDAPGLTGWAGWGPESVLFEAKPSEAAAVILTGDPDEGDE